MAMINVEEQVVEKSVKMRSDAHSRLVEIARKWLRNPNETKGRCFPVVCELVTAAGEVPDAIGWINGTSCLIECKTSYSDFLADAKKPWRTYPPRGMGNFKYYMAPVGIIKSSNLPEDWGLLEVSDDGKVVEVVKAKYQENCNKRSEIMVLSSVIRRNAEEATA